MIDINNQSNYFKFKLYFWQNIQNDKTELNFVFKSTKNPSENNLHESI